MVAQYTQNQSLFSIRQTENEIFFTNIRNNFVLNFFEISDDHHILIHN